MSLSADSETPQRRFLFAKLFLCAFMPKEKAEIRFLQIVGSPMEGECFYNCLAEATSFARRAYIIAPVGSYIIVPSGTTSLPFCGNAAQHHCPFAATPHNIIALLSFSS